MEDKLYVPAEDPYFRDPYIDVEEWRDTPVRHYYVHGGFHGTDINGESISRKKRNMRVDFSSICLRHRKVKMRQKVRRARIIKLPLPSHMEHILWFPIRADLC